MEMMEILKTLEISTMNTHFSSYAKLQNILLSRNYHL